MNRIKTLTPIALILGGFAPSVLGYVYLTCDSGARLNFGSGHMTFNLTTSLSTARKDAIRRGTNRVTQFSDSSITLNDNGDNSWGKGNGQNEVYMDPTHGTAQCWARYTISTCTVTEADILFGDEPWSTVDDSNSYTYGVNGRSMTGTAVHEGGHCVGMAHENRYYNMMGDDWDHVTRNGLNTYYGPGEDMSNGLINLHGKRSTTDAYRDLGVTVMRYQGVSGEYSAHKFGVLRDTSGTQLPVVGSYSGQSLFKVVAGNALRMEVTEENNGEKNGEAPSWGIYLSANDQIVSCCVDTLLSSGSYSLRRDLPYETSHTVTIPANTAEGDYFLGEIIDNDDAVNEVTSANNVAYYPIRVVDQAPPTPNPSTWLTEPAELNTSQIRMVATTATDLASAPAQYFFDYTGTPTGGAGGSDSAWQSSSTYTDSGLGVNHNYCYRARARDSAGTPNYTGYSSMSCDYTDIETPSGITFGRISPTSIQARSTNTPSGLTRGSSGLLIGNTTAASSSDWKQDNALWSSTGLTPNTSYTFSAIARNGDMSPTPWSRAVSQVTYAMVPRDAAFTNITDTSLQANWTANGNPRGTEYYAENTTAGTDSGWTTAMTWVSRGLSPNTPYTFQVRARNSRGVVTSWVSLGTATTTGVVCPNILVLTDETLAGTYQAHSEIQAGGSSPGSVVPSGASVLFQAADRILLGPNFTVQPGGQLSLQVGTDPCV